MANAILNKDEYQGYLFNTTGDLAIVYEGPYAKAVAPHPLTAEMFQTISDYKIGKRLSSIHVVCPYHKGKGKDKYPLRELRKGWHRIRLELELIAPNVKRVLLVSQSALLTQVVFPGMKGLPDTHGSILTLSNGLELVPTWQKVYEFMRPWKDVDIDRWKNLVKDAEPLPYQTNLDGIYGKHIVVDLETTGLNNLVDEITVLGVQWSDTDRALITDKSEIKLGIKKLVKLIKQGSHITFHNAQFDLGFMGQEFRDACTNYKAVHCTLIRSRSRGELVGTLKHLGNLYTNRPGNYAWANEGSTHEFDDPAYVTEDLHVTWELRKEFETEDNKPVVLQFEPALVMATEQSIHGSALAIEKLKTLYDEGKDNIALYEKLCIEEYGVHPGKTQEMVKVLIERGHELTDKTPNGNFQLNEDVCEEHGLYLLLQYRKAVKLDSSFIGKLWKLVRSDNTVGHYQNLLGAETGRTTMTNFNWQQASRKSPVRGLLVSRFDGGQLMICDLAQAELRVLALISNDELFAELFEQEDVHKSNASKAFNTPYDKVTKDQRYDAKAVIFKIVYGGSPITEGHKIVQRYFKKAFVKSFNWLDDTKEQSKLDVFITDPYGKTRNLLKVKTWRGLGGVGRAGVNSPIQGVASHIAMQVTYNAWWLFRKFELKSKVLFGVHDSLCADIHPAETDICRMLIRLAFAMLRKSNLYKVFPLASKLPILGELQEGESWGWIDNEENDVPTTECSSHDPITLDECMDFYYGKDNWF